MGRVGTGALIALAFGLAVPAISQPRDEQVATDISLIELDEPDHGSMAMIDGRIGTEQRDRYTLANLSLFQPVKVSLVAEDVGQPVTLQLGKFDWKEDFGGGPTGESGLVTEEFKTQGDLLLSVTGDQGAGYRLIIWAGQEVVPEMESVLVPASEAGGGIPIWAWAVAALAALLGGGWWVMRKRRAT
ncbi:MAG TPA: hypothetical protein VNA29_05545 [Sphingomicrobium sp.]|nr:hypothetical protein [Sphingomicrobium sp.]